MTEHDEAWVEFCGQVVPVRVRRFGSDISQRQAERWPFEQRRRRQAEQHARLTVWTGWLAGGALVVSTAHVAARVLIG